MAAKKKPKKNTAKSKAKALPKKAAKAKAKKAAKTRSAKPAKAKAKPVKTKPSKATAKPVESKPVTSKPAKTKPSAKPKSSLTEKVMEMAAKVRQATAAAVVKMLDSDMGRPAPAFELSDEKGDVVSSASLAGKPYLLYFYPKDDTPGCTKEACDIRDNFARFGQQGLRVLGVSPDSQQSHAKFGQKYGLPFTLLSDPDKTLATSYGVWGEKENYGRKYMGIIRSSFLVGPDGVIKKAYRKVRVDGHVAAILEDAKAML